MSRKRILLVIERHRQDGGAETAFMQISQLLMANGHAVGHFTLAAQFPEKSCQAEHYFAYAHFLDSGKKDAHLLQRMFRSLLTRALRIYYSLACAKKTATGLERAIRLFRPDIVHFHSIFEFIAPEIFEVPKRMGIPSVMTGHTSWIACPTSSLLRGNGELCDGICAVEENPGQSCKKYRCVPTPVAREALAYRYHRIVKSRCLSSHLDVLIASSPSLAGIIERSQMFPQERVRLVYNPANPQLMAMTSDLGEALPEKTYFFATGQINRFKGFDVLIEAFKDLPEIPLVIAGDGLERKNLERYVTEQGFTHIRFVGWQPIETLFQLFQDAYAFIIPSTGYETAPLVIQESFAHGKPVIGSNVGGIPDFVIPEETGLLFERQQAIDLRAQVVRLWSDPALALRLGQNGYQQFKERFDPDTGYQKLMDAYEDAARYSHERVPVGV
jgi:glycosyltransferase involved in cell wall biosynthesis